MFLGTTNYLTSAEILFTGSKYTFTFDHGRLFEYNSATYVLEQMRNLMQNYGEIVTVNRAMFSSRYVIVVVPKIDTTLLNWLTAFNYAWKTMGYNNTTFIVVEAGDVSSQPGGTTQIVKSAGTAAGETVMEMIQPLLPVIIGVGVILVGLSLYRRQ